MCRGRDSNPHELWAHRFLRPARLPFRHLGIICLFYQNLILFGSQALVEKEAVKEGIQEALK